MKYILLSILYANFYFVMQLQGGEMSQVQSRTAGREAGECERHPKYPTADSVFDPQSTHFQQVFLMKNMSWT